jgi:hypothetical protein
VKKFQHGGIVTGPTMGMLGEAGPEAVVPLNKIADTDKTGFQKVVDKLDQMLNLMRQDQSFGDILSGFMGANLVRTGPGVTTPGGGGGDGTTPGGAGGGRTPGGTGGGGGGGRTPGRGGAGTGGGTTGGGPLQPADWKAAGESKGALTALYKRAAIKAAGGDNAEAQRIFQVMQGIRAGESAHGSKYDYNPNDPSGGAFGPFQMVGGGRMGTQFQKETGKDFRDPRTIPDQADYVARYIHRTGYGSKWGGPQGRLGAPWYGYKGPMKGDPRWGESGYHPAAGSEDAGKAARSMAPAPKPQEGLKPRPDAGGSPPGPQAGLAHQSWAAVTHQMVHIDNQTGGNTIVTANQMMAT